VKVKVGAAPERPTTTPGALPETPTLCWSVVTETLKLVPGGTERLPGLTEEITARDGAAIPMTRISAERVSTANQSADAAPRVCTIRPGLTVSPSASVT
jgi:hypothetical protein